MGEEPGTSRAAVSAEETEQLEREIAQTRHQLGETVEALAEKADIKRQARQKLDETKASVTEKRDELLEKAKEVSPETATSAAASATEKARQNPLPVATVSAFAAGVILGRLSRRG